MQRNFKVFWKHLGSFQKGMNLLAHHLPPLFSVSFKFLERLSNTPYHAFTDDNLKLCIQTLEAWRRCTLFFGCHQSHQLNILTNLSNQTNAEWQHTGKVATLAWGCRWTAKHSQLVFTQCYCRGCTQCLLSSTSLGPSTHKRPIRFMKWFWELNLIILCKESRLLLVSHFINKSCKAVYSFKKTKHTCNNGRQERKANHFWALKRKRVNMSNSLHEVL